MGSKLGKLSHVSPAPAAEVVGLTAIMELAGLVVGRVAVPASAVAVGAGVFVEVVVFVLVGRTALPSLLGRVAVDVVFVVVVVVVVVGRTALPSELGVF